MLHPLTALVTCVALVMYFALEGWVGWARGKYGIVAPATTGNPDFERIFRIHQNTLESLAMFLPALWMFSAFVSPQWASALGVLWIVGRLVYARGYAIEAKRRGLGFTIAAFAAVVLVLGAGIGAVMKLVAG